MTDLTNVRIEHDLLGEREVPADVYWGVHTLRAMENFPITGVPIAISPYLPQALAAVKEAAAEANHDLGLLDDERHAAIVQACQEIRHGALHDQFVVDVIQGGAGTSTNMNANEVIANRALEILGHPLGGYDRLHPNEQVNLSQSTNDVYPTAVKIAVINATHDLIAAMGELESAFAEKAVEFHDVLKMGRTQLQDAVPMTLGQEFGTYALMIAEDRTRLREAVMLLHEINLGATAIGTQLNAPDGYVPLARQHLSRITGLPLVTAVDLIEATQDCGSFVQMSGVLKRVAVKLSKICNDLRLLSSGPRAGLGEINLPARQAGSSIMPGKVNPVIPEVVNQVAFQIIGHDVTVSMAAESGQLQLNAFEPVICYSLSAGLYRLRTAITSLTENCVKGITANREHLAIEVANSIGLVTALNPYLGYQTATELAKEALASGRGVAELVLEKGLLPKDELERILRPETLAHLGPKPADRSGGV
ncbi:aspartate ammonia-lyase [Aeromicrobium tamlense]|uniref:aspartate ammonia-lyase n=1 Tax=Aeromicrobium tamlense TaxID=375541 RepID=A0A8I0FUB4_9ACTN|nr:aspartate ammonia-lyase [Aeromicrobium tamlense]MBD1270644.1 aspartate ammonia-lyase [Aeromicrobium tamlense]MBD1271224.1 aspartate ammonia-lyase [Aeromicrobium tamlense]NYI38033.1 aspartate ammonia-lyase [Aeromicrobium tamlense]